MTQAAQAPAEAQIASLIDAQFSLLYIVSPEEAVVEVALRRIASDRTAGRSMRVKSWSCSKGFIEPPKKVGDPEVGDGETDPVAALAVIEKEVDPPTLWVLRDFDAFFESPTVRRALRDVSAQLRFYQSACCVLSPRLSVPQGLEREMEVVSWDLPSADEIDAFVAGFTAKAAEVVRDRILAEPRDAVVEACRGLSTREIEDVLALALVLHGRYDVATILDAKEQAIRKSGVLEFVRPGDGGLGGLDGLRAWLTQRRRSMSKEAAAFGIPTPRGLCAVGPPGTGKSLIAKVTAREWGVPLIKLDVGRVFQSLVGQSEANIRDAIKTAEATAPCLLWLDELEKGFRADASAGDSGTSARVLGTLLTWMQEKTAPVFVLATCNRPDLLPAELVRKGRFDEIFFVDLPAPVEREEIFSVHLRGRGRDPTAFDLDALAQATPGFSGSEIEQAVIEGLHAAFAANRELVQDDVEAACHATTPLSTFMADQVAAMRNWCKARTRPASTAPAAVSVSRAASAVSRVGRRGLPS